MLQRAYATLELKAVDDDKRIVEGIASTPQTDRMGDIVEPKGASFSLPIPLLWQHRAGEPIGHVLSATVTATGIKIRAQLAKIDEPGKLKDRLDEAWQSLKSGLVRGLSIGFDPIESMRIEGTFGRRFVKWDWLELSAVTIPANAAASITSIKAYDAPYLPASGHSAPHRSAGVSASPEGRSMTIAERIAQKRAALITKNTRFEDLITLEERSAEQQQELDTVRGEVSSLTKEVGDLDVVERAQLATATQVIVRADDAAAPPVSRQHTERSRIEVAEVPKGTAFVRYVKALMLSRGDLAVAERIAKAQPGWRDTTPQVLRVLKAAVDVGTTVSGNWGAGLFDYTLMASEFIETTYPLTIIGRIPNLHNIPFNVKVPRQTEAASVGWVGQGAMKPVSRSVFDQVTFPEAKAAGIIVFSQELARNSNPGAEAVLERALRKALVKFLDEQFISSAISPVSNVSPGGITNGSGSAAPTAGASGNDAADFREDLRAALGSFIAGGISAGGLVVVMEETQAVGLALMRTQFGVKEFPDLTPAGGSIEGYQAVTSESVPTGDVVLLKPDEIFVALGGIEIDVSREATVTMDDGGGTGTEAVNLWQNNLIGLRVESQAFWQRRRDKATYRISSATYGQPS